MLVDTINTILGILTIIAQIFIALAIIYFLVFKNKYSAVSKFFQKNAINLCFIISLVAVSGSLFYSLYAHFDPCNLCWFQRIFMYPLLIIFFVGEITKDKNVYNYAFPVAILGTIISIYHNYIYNKGIASLVCTITEPCTTPYVTVFGYIGIPLMALTAFIAIITLLIIKKQTTDKTSEIS